MSAGQPALQFGESATREGVFRRLKPVCDGLLASRADERALAAHLGRLQQVLDSAVASALQACFDYVAFPLLYIVDSIDFTRRADTSGGPEVPRDIPIPAARSDRAAETALRCLATLLQRCQPDDAAVPALLSRICPLLQLPRAAVTEEIRAAALQGMAELLSQPHSSLAEAENAALVGFASHVLLAAADAEIQAGSTGGKAVLAAAVASLGCLVDALAGAGGQDTLAFLLPGLVGGLYKVLLASGSSHGPRAKSGAAASTRATQAAMRALTALLCATLANDPADGPAAAPAEPDAAAALATLRQMQLRRASNAAASTSAGPAGGAGRAAVSRPGQRLRVERTAEWKAATAEKLRERLEHILPLLQAHPQAAVRAALATGAVQLLQQCGRSLAACAPLLLQAVFSLAQDGWAEVASPCTAFLAASGSGRERQAAAQQLAARSLRGLPGALEQGADTGRLHAQSAASALQVAGPQAAAALLRDPGQLLATCQALQQAFAFDRASAALLLYASAATGSYAALPAADTPSAAERQASNEAAESSSHEMQQATPGPAAGADAPAPASAAQPAAVLLPCMPLGLRLISGAASYEAVAGVCRSLGRLAAADGGALRSLADQLLAAADAAAAGGAPGWQCEAAAAVAVLAEALFGASPAWQPARWLGAPAAAAQDSRALLEAVDAAQQLLVSERLWGVRTQNASDAPALTPQELGENALLARSLLHAVGTFARCLGPAYLQTGGLARTALLPLLERLGDGCPGVAAAAEEAVGSLCLHCGCGDLRQLVAANLDYVVDGVCSRLRRPDAHPRSPLLFAVLLRRCGVAPALLPLMAEPARAAVRSLSICARARRPAQVAAFLAALQEVVAGAALEADQVLAEMRAAAAAVTEAVRARRAAAAAAAAQPASEAWEAGAFFRARLQEAEAEGQPSVEWDADAWAAAERLRRRLHAAAALADAAADAAAPLLTHSSLQVVLLAVGVSAAALRALQATSAAVEAHERSIEPHVAPRSGVQPVAPETPRVLPAVHRLWAPLLVALKDARVVVLEAALPLLAALADASGGNFLAKRLRAEGWPLLAQLLKRGPCPAAASGGGSGPARALLEGGEGEGWAPAVVRRTRQAVLDSLAAIAGSAQGRAALKGVIADAGRAAIELLAGSEAAAIKRPARQLLASLAQLDSDAVWLLLLLHLPGAQPGADAAVAVGEGLLPWQQLRPGRAWFEKGQAGGERVATALLREVEAAPPAWHARLSREHLAT